MALLEHFDYVLLFFVFSHFFIGLLLSARWVGYVYDYIWVVFFGKYFFCWGLTVLSAFRGYFVLSSGLLEHNLDLVVFGLVLFVLGLVFLWLFCLFAVWFSLGV